MSRAQLEALVWRIREGASFDASDPRNQGREPPAKPTEVEQEIIQKYVQSVP